MFEPYNTKKIWDCAKGIQVWSKKCGIWERSAIPPETYFFKEKSQTKKGGPQEFVDISGNPAGNAGYGLTYPSHNPPAERHSDFCYRKRPRIARNLRGRLPLEGPGGAGKKNPASQKIPKRQNKNSWQKKFCSTGIKAGASIRGFTSSVFLMATHANDLSPAYSLPICFVSYVHIHSSGR